MARPVPTNMRGYRQEAEGLMAKVIELKRPSRDERAALTFLAASLPDDFMLTTPARNIGGRELDGVVLAPTGILALEYKHWRGEVQPSPYGPWKQNGKNNPRAGNPFEQAEDASKRLASHLKKRIVGGQLPCFVDFVVVLTHPESRLELGQIRMSKDARKVCLLRDGVDSICSLLAPSPVFDPEDLRKLVACLVQPSTSDIVLSAAKPPRVQTHQASVDSENLAVVQAPDKWRSRFQDMVETIDQRNR